MITNLESLLKQEQFLELLGAISSNQNYCFSENGLTIKTSHKDGALTIECSYEEPNMVEKELEDFKSYTESLDDDLFVEVCEFLGEVELQKIQKCISSNDIESIRAGALKFKQSVRIVIAHKIQYLTDLANL